MFFCSLCGLGSEFIVPYHGREHLESVRVLSSHLVVAFSRTCHKQCELSVLARLKKHGHLVLEDILYLVIHNLVASNKTCRPLKSNRQKRKKIKIPTQVHHVERQFISYVRNKTVFIEKDNLIPPSPSVISKSAIVSGL